MSKDSRKKYINKLNNTAFDISFDAENKEETFQSRTGKWQKSEKGVAYREDIDNLYSLENDIRDLLERYED